MAAKTGGKSGDAGDALTAAGAASNGTSEPEELGMLPQAAPPSDGKELTPAERLKAWAVGRVGLQFPPGLSYRDWAAMGPLFRSLSNHIHWAIGDWINYGEKRFGQMYSQAIESTGYEYGYLADIAWVSSVYDFSRRRENLPFSFHREAAAKELDDEDREKLLNSASLGTDEQGAPICMRRDAFRGLVKEYKKTVKGIEPPPPPQASTPKKTKAALPPPPSAAPAASAPRTPSVMDLSAPQSQGEAPAPSVIASKLDVAAISNDQIDASASIDTPPASDDQDPFNDGASPAPGFAYGDAAVYDAEYVEQLKKRLETYEAQLTLLEGVNRELQAKIDRYEADPEAEVLLRIKPSDWVTLETLRAHHSKLFGDEWTPENYAGQLFEVELERLKKKGVLCG